MEYWSLFTHLQLPSVYNKRQNFRRNLLFMTKDVKSSSYYTLCNTSIKICRKNPAWFMKIVLKPLYNALPCLYGEASYVWLTASIAKKQKTKNKICKPKPQANSIYVDQYVEIHCKMPRVLIDWKQLNFIYTYPV